MGLFQARLKRDFTVKKEFWIEQRFTSKLIVMDNEIWFFLPRCAARAKERNLYDQAFQNLLNHIKISLF